MDIEPFTNPSSDFKEHVEPIETGDSRPQSSLRIKYSAEVQLIIHKWGRLEDMRKTLGLSQRKICQLLLVDPSAWTRWTKNTNMDDAPPHIFRALSWYLLLLDKSPELSPYVFLQTVARPNLPEMEVRKLTERITQDVHNSFEGELRALRKSNRTLMMALATMIACGIVYLGFSLIF